MLVFACLVYDIGRHREIKKKKDDFGFPQQNNKDGPFVHTFWCSLLIGKYFLVVLS